MDELRTVEIEPSFDVDGDRPHTNYRDWEIVYTETASPYAATADEQGRDWGYSTLYVHHYGVSKRWKDFCATAKKDYVTKELLPFYFHRLLTKDERNRWHEDRKLRASVREELFRLAMQWVDSMMTDDQIDWGKIEVMWANWDTIKEKTDG